MRKTGDTTPLPCPFCGSKKIFRRGPYMHCAYCGCEGPLIEYDSGDEVVLAWNRRSKLVEAQNTAHNIGSPKLSQETFEWFHCLVNKSDRTYAPDAVVKLNQVLNFVKRQLRASA